MTSGDLIFKYLFKCQKNKECFWIKTKHGETLVDCARVDGAIGIICSNTEWVGTRVAAANRLEMLGAEINDNGSPCGVKE